jgi:hypothetical protein
MSTIITAAWANDIVTRWNTALSLSLSSVSQGQKITSKFFTDIAQKGDAAAAILGFHTSHPLLQSLAVGQTIKMGAWPTPTALPTGGSGPSPAIYSWGLGGNQANAGQAGTFTWTVPAGVTSVMVNWLIAGGAAGGSGDAVGNGGGGGGGGSGGFYHWAPLTVNPGDVLTIIVGGGGLLSSNPIGVAGSGSSILINNIKVLGTTGGGGGGQGTNGIGGQGGPGGGPTGLTGQQGPAGTNDFANSWGAGGAPGPIETCHGGAGGTLGGGGDFNTGSSAGKAGIGPGSGGGGGGCLDRVGGRWNGGAGCDGYVEICAPSQGATGGTAAEDNSGYSSQAIANGVGPGGFYTGGSGLNGGNASGIG